MAMTIAHNISAINTQRNLSITQRGLGKSLEKLSSGYRINVGADGPADLIISEQLRAQGSGLERAVRNTQEAMNVIGIAEGALNEMNEILKKMRALALHAANSGITSPIQVAADQSEMDSSIQTIDRIANTTKYSDQLLLNGGKELVYDRSTTIKGTNQNALLNVGQSNLQQVFKYDGYQVSLSFSGTASPNATTGDGVANVKQEARKAYFEIDTDATNPGDVNTSGAITASQKFILTGNKGSRQFSFDTGATVGQIAAAIANVSDSTGVDASLIFSNAQTDNDVLTTAAADTGNIGGGSARAVGNWAMFNKEVDAKGITGIATNLVGVVVGKNTDGQGRIYVKYTSNTSAEFYKDASMSNESLVATATNGAAMVAQNNSGLTSGGNVTIANGLTAGTAEYIAATGIEGVGASGVTASGGMTAAGGDGEFDRDLTLLSGVELGKNTDSEGRIYIKVIKTADTTGSIFAYKDAAMRSEDLVAQSKNATGTGTAVSLVATQTIMLNEIRNDENTAGTGLGIALNTVTAWSATSGGAGTEVTSTIQFDNLGVRIASSEYGADQFVKIQQQEGSVWRYYQQADSNVSTLVDAGTSGTTVQQNGQNATIGINGTQVETNGLELNVSTQDMQGTLVFNEGKVGTTTIAQVGYTEGSIYSRAGWLTDTATGTTAGTQYGAHLTNAGHSTTEILNHFRGGMQFQIGEGAGDQERTVYSVESMAVANLGQTSFTAQFDSSKAVIETKTLSLADVLGGGFASLGSDPVKALSIIDNAISDVSSLRARLGATQANLLQTNANSLQVAMENIAKTESMIRDADMAAETTEFTKNQILVSAGTSMLAQANVMSQNVLQLLG